MTKTNPSTMAIEIWEIEKILPFAGNAKKHSAQQVEVLAGLIKKNGWTQPIVVDGDGEIIAGHGRRLAAIKAGFKKVPVVVRRDLTKIEANALRLADNRVSSTEYDTNLLQEQMKELAAHDVDLMELGYSEKELTFMTEAIGEIDLESFTQDVGTAVEEQKAENDRKAAEIDGSAAPLADAMGFKRISVQQSRAISSWMRQIEHLTGKSGAEAFVEYITNHYILKGRLA